MALEARSVLPIKLSQFYYRFKLSTDNTTPFTAYTWGRLSPPPLAHCSLECGIPGGSHAITSCSSSMSDMVLPQGLGSCCAIGLDSLSSFGSWAHAFASSRSTVVCHLSDQLIKKDTACKETLYSAFLFPTALITTRRTV